MKQADFYKYDFDNEIIGRKNSKRKRKADANDVSTFDNVRTYKLKPTFKARMMFNNGYGVDIIEDHIYENKYELAILVGVSLEDSVVFTGLNGIIEGNFIDSGVVENLTLHEAFEIAEALQQWKKAKGFSTNIIIG